MDGLDQFALQPKCPECGTVLRDVKNGWVCVSCNEAYRSPGALSPQLVRKTSIITLKPTSSDNT